MIDIDISHLDLIRLCNNYLNAINVYNDDMNVGNLQKANDAGENISQLFKLV